MSTFKDVVTLSILAGLGLAVLANAGSASSIITSVSQAWFGLINTVSAGGRKLGT
jgi:hypothetical protein